MIPEQQSQDLHQRRWEAFVVEHLIRDRFFGQILSDKKKSSFFFDICMLPRSFRSD